MADSDQFPPSPDDLRRLMSSMMDGDASSTSPTAATKAWKEHVVARQSWHEYHVIGDVMRNEEMAHGALGDEAFLQALRAKLADEPAVLAPAAVAPSRAPAGSVWWRWAAPAAVAAGFMAVASVLVVSRSASPAPEAAGMALAPRGPAPAALSASAMSGLDANGSGIVVRRDEALDAYLRAHRETSAASTASWAGASARVTNAALVHSK